MSDPDTAVGKPSRGTRIEAFFIRTLSRPKLHYALAGITVLLSSPALFLGYKLDDYVLRYIYGDLPGAEKLYDILSGGYGVANGNPADTLWQIEEGWAPWWTNQDLLIRLFRPLGAISHKIDAALWPDIAPLAHAHSLVWMAVLVLAATRLFRSTMDQLVGGRAALLLAIDHTHGFTVGYIGNRHALMSATFCVLCLAEHIRFREHGEKRGAVLAPLLLVLGFCTSESTIAVVGYLVAYAAFVERGPIARRMFTVAPYLAIATLWRVLYSAAGYGAVGSGVYLDPGREPGRFLLALLERGPLLVLGQFFAPPAEFQILAEPPVAQLVGLLATLFFVVLLLALIPLMKRERKARFWAAGSLLSIILASTAYPHNRLLLMASIGAVALIAQLWQMHTVDLYGKRLRGLMALSASVGAIVAVTHLYVSPLALPLTTMTSGVSAPLHAGIHDVGDEIGGRDAVFLTMPDFFAVRLVHLSRRIQGSPLPRRWRTLSCGPEPVTVHRSDARTLTLDVEGGVLTKHIQELYRDRRMPMPPGMRVELEGMTAEVLEVTRDGRAKRVSFCFDERLEADSFRFYYWKDGGFAPFELPKLGDSRKLPPALLEWTL